MGVLYSQCGHWDAALAALQQAVALAPDDGEAQAGLGVVASLLGRWQEAAQAFSRVVFGCAEGAASPLSYYPEALQFFGRLLQPRPEPGPLRADLLVSKTSRASRPDRLETLKQAVAANPQALAGYYELGETYMSLGRYPEAVAAYRTAVKLNPDAAEGRYHLAVAYRSLGDLEAAMREYSVLRTLNEPLARQLFA
jgi:tetratricopeptide (TPR) repeat protein